MVAGGRGLFGFRQANGTLYSGLRWSASQVKTVCSGLIERGLRESDWLTGVSSLGFNFSLVAVWFFCLADL